MTLAITSPVGQRRQLGWGLAWAAAFAVALGLYLLRDRFPWIAAYPTAWIIPVASWINATMGPATDLLFGFTRSITAILAVPLDLAMNVVAVPLGVLLGLFLGISGYRHPGFNRGVLIPLLDIAQATPQFAYLVPMLIF